MTKIPLLSKKPANPDGRMAVMDHLRELRRRLIIVIILIALGAIIGWLAYNPIMAVLKHPYCNVPFKHRFGALNQSRQQCNLVFRGPLDGFTIRLKVAVIAGAVITSPLWLYQLWAFVTPGLHKNEKKWTVAFVATSVVLFAAGAALSYFTLSKGLDVLVGSAGHGIQAQLDVAGYISFVILVLVVFGASFELPLLIVMLNAVRVLPYSVLKRGQRLGIFLVFLFAAVATPSTDPFTMCALAIPMALLFELSVFWSFLYDRRRAKRIAAAEVAQLPDDVASMIDPLPQRIEPRADSHTSQWSDLP
jgi:sec-independent protein translocase protein TatC